MKRFLSIFGVMLFVVASSFFAVGCNKDYYITISDQIVHGSIFSSVGKAKFGDLIIITAIPDEGYMLEESSLKADDELIVSFNFTMPQHSVVITANFVEIGVDNQTNSFDLCQSVADKTQNLVDNYCGKPNTLDGEREVVDIPDFEIYLTISPVNNQENAEIRIFGEVVDGERNMVVGLGNNRFIEKPVYKKIEDTFYFLLPVAHAFSVGGIVDVSIGDQDYELVIESVTSALTIETAQQNQVQLEIADDIVNALYLNDAILNLTLQSQNTTITENALVNSAITIIFDDQSQMVVLQCGAIDQSVFTISLLNEFLPDDKQVIAYNVLSNVIGVGLFEFGVEFHPEPR